MRELKDKVRTFVVENFLFGNNENLEEKTSFLEEGITLGSIVPNEVYKFIAVVSQEKAFDLFRESQLKGEVKLDGVAQKTIKLANIQVIPYVKNQLPSAALGWAGGGDSLLAGRE